jgi:hypothetical protein
MFKQYQNQVENGAIYPLDRYAPFLFKNAWLKPTTNFKSQKFEKNVVVTR